MDKLLYRPKEAAYALGMGRTAVYEFIRSGRLQSVKLGGYRFVTADALRDFVQRLEAENFEPAEQVA